VPALTRYLRGAPFVLAACCVAGAARAEDVSPVAIDAGAALLSPSTRTALRVTQRLHGPRLSFDRVDLLSEDTGTWVNYELPLVGANTTTTLVRFVEQVKVSFTLPVERFYAGVSFASQSLNYEYPLVPSWGLGLNLGLHTKLLLPRGVFLSASWRCWHTRVAVGVSLTSVASWARPDWSSWTVLPTLAIGFGRRAHPEP
jgi:hypothetical protein